MKYLTKVGMNAKGLIAINDSNLIVWGPICFPLLRYFLNVHSRPIT